MHAPLLSLLGNSVVICRIAAKEGEVQLLVEKLQEYQEALPEARRKVGTQRDHLAVAQHELVEKKAALETVERKYVTVEAELSKLKVIFHSYSCLGRFMNFR